MDDKGITYGSDEESENANYGFKCTEHFCMKTKSQRRIAASVYRKVVARAYVRSLSVRRLSGTASITSTPAQLLDSLTIRGPGDHMSERISEIGDLPLSAVNQADQFELEEDPVASKRIDLKTFLQRGRTYGEVQRERLVAPRSVINVEKSVQRSLQRDGRLRQRRRQARLQWSFQIPMGIPGAALRLRAALGRPVG